MLNQEGGLHTYEQFRLILNRDIILLFFVFFNSTVSLDFFPVPHVTSSAPGEFEMQHIKCLPKYQAVVCQVCKYAIPPLEVRGHFKGKAHRMKNLRLIERWSQLALEVDEVEVPLFEFSILRNSQDE